MPHEDSMRAANKQLYQQWIEQLWNGPGSADRLREVAAALVTTDFVGHWPSRDVRGPDELAALIAETRAMFSALTFEIEVAPLADADLVAGRWSGAGTLPDGTVAAFYGNDILRVRDGRFCEYWVASAER